MSLKMSRFWSASDCHTDAGAHAPLCEPQPHVAAEAATDHSGEALAQVEILLQRFDEADDKAFDEVEDWVASRVLRDCEWCHFGVADHFRVSHVGQVDRDDRARSTRTEEGRR